MEDLFRLIRKVENMEKGITFLRDQEKRKARRCESETSVFY